MDVNVLRYNNLLIDMLCLGDITRPATLKRIERVKWPLVVKYTRQAILARVQYDDALRTVPSRRVVLQPMMT